MADFKGWEQRGEDVHVAELHVLGEVMVTKPSLSSWRATAFGWDGDPMNSADEAKLDAVRMIRERLHSLCEGGGAVGIPREDLAILSEQVDKLKPGV